jgi:hypothetical protein
MTVSGTPAQGSSFPDHPAPIEGDRQAIVANTSNSRWRLAREVTIRRCEALLGG